MDLTIEFLASKNNADNTFEKINETLSKLTELSINGVALTDERQIANSFND